MRVRAPRIACMGAVLLLLLATGACSRDAPAPADAPSVVSLSPLASRLLLKLGAVERFVGVDAESARHPGFAGIEVVDVSRALALRPSLLVVDALPLRDASGAPQAVPEGVRVALFEPHDLEDVAAFARDVGADLVGWKAVADHEATWFRPLGLLGGASKGQIRPRVIAVVNLDPLEIAGGHSFETDVIQAAGGTSITHGGEDVRLPVKADEWAVIDPDLVLVVVDALPSADEEAAIRNALGRAAPIAFFRLDRTFWLDEIAGPGRRLREVILPLSQRLEAQGS